MASICHLMLIALGLISSSIQAELGLSSNQLDTSMQKCKEGDAELDKISTSSKEKEDIASKPLQNPNYLIENNGVYFEGDLKISDELIDAYYGYSPNIQTLTPAGIWPNGEYHYICDKTVDGTTKNLIGEAINIWSRSLGSCLDFIMGKCNLGYVKFTTIGHGCYSTSVGYQGALVHIINLASPACTDLHTVLHEIGHTLGYWHEQSRPDRDKYVKIDYSHLRREYRTQLSKQSPWGVSVNDMIYDYGSIMHYSQFAFSSDGQRTINIVNVTEYELQGSPVLGAGTSLSAADITAMKKHYMCK